MRSVSVTPLPMLAEFLVVAKNLAPVCENVLKARFERHIIGTACQAGKLEGQTTQSNSSEEAKARSVPAIFLTNHHRGKTRSIAVVGLGKETHKALSQLK